MKKNIIKKASALVLFFTMAIGALIGCGGSDKTAKTDDGRTVVRLGEYTSGSDQYIRIIGTNKGFFEKYGISIEANEYASGINTVDAIVTGQEDIGYVADYALINRIGNTQDSFNIKIVSREQTSALYNLYVYPDEIKSLADLNGKNIITHPGTILDYYSDVAFDKAGVAKKDRNLINVDSGQAALAVLASHGASAYWASGNTAKKLRENGLEKLVSMKDLGLSVDSYYVASDSFIKSSPDTVTKFLKAVKETEEWIVNNLQEAGEIIEKEKNVPKEQVVTSLQAQTLTVDLDSATFTHLNDIKKWCIDNGKFSKDFDLEKFTDRQFINEVNK